jgi:hypothetical protein
MLADLEPAYLREGWERYSIEHGAVYIRDRNDTSESGMTWVAEQVRPFFTLRAATSTVLSLDL